VTELLLDAAASRVRIQTFAEGLLARLAHDLELGCSGLTGTAIRVGEDGTSTGSARIEAPLRDLSVLGVLGKDGRVDERALTPSERREIVAKMYNDVFHARPDASVRIEATLEGGRARVRLVPPHGPAVETSIEPQLRTDGRFLRVSGTFDLALSSIGSDAIKGPMGAFRVKDRVRVVFDVAFAAAPQPA
jgi:hypothetical protein